jgi:DNA-binding MarR family transcriptional regulator
MTLRRARENLSTYPIASLVKQLRQTFIDALDERLRPYGITPAQLHVLAKLEYEPGISGARLARACGVKPQTTQVLLRGIEANGWITRSRHPENERILLATLTPAGRRVLARSRTAVGDIHQRMVRSFSAEEVRQLETLLSGCIANLQTVANGGAMESQNGKHCS